MSVSLQPRTSSLAAVLAERLNRPPQPQPQVVEAKPRQQASRLSQASQQAKPASLPRPAQLIPAGELSTPELYQSLRQSTTKLRHSLVEISYYGWRLRQRNAWGDLGLADEEAARLDLGLSSNLWETYLMLGERLASADMTLDQMRALSVESARLLTRVHPKLWNEFAWIDEARMLSVRQFATLVDERNSQVTLAVQRQLAEPRTRLAMLMPASQRAGVESRLAAVRQQRNLKSNAEALAAALTAAERETLLVVKLAGLQQQLAGLASLWPAGQPWSAGLAETTAELESRLGSEDADDQVTLPPAPPTSLPEAAERTQQIATRLTRTMEDINAFLA